MKDAKVHIFWEGHEILRNFHLTFDFSTYSHKLGEEIAKFCGLLRIYELYLHDSWIAIMSKIGILLDKDFQLMIFIPSWSTTLQFRLLDLFSSLLLLFAKLGKTHPWHASQILFGSWLVSLRVSSTVLV